ncbi:MAG: hypothetical protein EBU90_02335 [Proteobacteria bacterium]|nr:hypothetical protein [Pseudomonadota bacterium]NBP13073.1 hypothetical protein [bacterium]
MSKKQPSFRIKTNTPGKIIVLEGDMFSFSTGNGLYLSSNKFDGSQQYCDFYSLIQSVSAGNPPFSAYPVKEFTVNTNNTLHFELSSFSSPQKIDIIYANEAGYRLASSGKRFTYIEIVSAYS